MANLSYAWSSGLLCEIFQGITWPKNADLYVGLTSQPPTNLGYTEVPNVGGYARQHVSPSTSDFSFNYTTSGVVYNNVQISFPIANANIGMVSGIILTDSGTYNAGNMIFYGNMTPAKDYQTNDQLYIPVSGLVCTMS